MQIKIINRVTEYHVFIIESEYNPKLVNEFRNIKDKHGWQKFCWNGEYWCFSDISIIEDLKQLEWLEIIVKEETEEISLVDTDYEYPLPLYDFQVEAINFIEKQKGIGMLNLEMGLGKSICTLAYLQKHNLKTLVICPNTLKYNWSGEITKWTPEKTVSVIEAKNKALDFKKDISIINYDIVKKNLAIIKKEKFDLIVGDESQMIKSRSSTRSLAVRELVAKHKILLSGTPMTKDILDLWSQLNFLYPEQFPNYFKFASTYSNRVTKPWGVEYVGQKNIDKLKFLVKNIIFTRKKKDVAQHLPDKIHQTLIIVISSDGQTQYTKALKDFKAFLTEHKDYSELEASHTLRAEAMVKIGFLRRICALDKIPYAIELISELISNGRKVVVFSNYIDVVDLISEAFGEASVCIKGEIESEDRSRRVKMFQEDENIMVFVGTIQSCGTGITLTASSDMVFIDMPYTWADLGQAIDRCHRIGSKKDNLNIRYLISKVKDDFSVDDRIYNVVAQRKETEDELFNQKKKKSFIQSVLSSFK